MTTQLSAWLLLAMLHNQRVVLEDFTEFNSTFLMVLFLSCMQEAVHSLDQSAQTGTINSAQHIPYRSLISILPVNEGKGERGKEREIVGWFCRDLCVGKQCKRQLISVEIN